MVVINCINCYSVNKKNNKFCINCGFSFKSQQILEDLDNFLNPPAWAWWTVGIIFIAAVCL